MFILIDILVLALNVLWWILVAQIVLSWLVAFNVVNLGQPFVRGLHGGLDRLTEPMYRPIRRILPDFGGIDFSPLVILLLISFIQRELVKVSYTMLVNG